MIARLATPSRRWRHVMADGGGGHADDGHDVGGGHDVRGHDVGGNDVADCADDDAGGHDGAYYDGGDDDDAVFFRSQVVSPTSQPFSW